MAGQHSDPPRGLDATRSPLFQGRFGRLFRNLPAAQFGADDDETLANLTTLAAKMVADFDPPKDGPDGEESGIPALYTYFGQFIDHDITFDPVSLLTKSRDPDGLVDFRTPALDLDNIYGRGPGDQPYMYDGNKFRLGDPLKGQGVPDTVDLPRFAGRALIGDPRNDENNIVAQLQLLFLRFHNRLADDNPGYDFETLQRQVRFHYQYVVLNDFLGRIVAQDVLELLKTNGQFDQGKLAFYHWRDEPFMPVEFSVAAYRLGHSMIRPGYRMNDDDASLLPIFPVPSEGLNEGLTGFRPIPAGRAIDWGRFIDIDTRPYGTEDDATDANNKTRLQFAYRIDASLVDPLGQLPDAIASDVKSLALRNLLRSWRLQLPSGQAVANAMNLTPLTDAQILIGKATGDPGDTDPILDVTGVQAFAGNCPLWAYILAEASQNQHAMPISATGGPGTIATPQLGPVGGRIVAEVFLGMLFGDNFSMLSQNPNFTPMTGSGPNFTPKPDFKLKDLVAYALGQGPALH